jgi:diguanylate cyclase (GGDEF)-like protein
VEQPAVTRGAPPAPAHRREPLVDLPVRWRAGQIALGAAGVATVFALTRPLGPQAGAWPRLIAILLLGLGVAGAAFLASLKGRGVPAQLAFYAFLVLSLDGLGQMLAPAGWPVWPLLSILVVAVTVAEPPPVAYGVASLAALLAVADGAQGSFAGWKPAVAATLGYAALVLALQLALKLEKRRLTDVQAELVRLRHGIDELEEREPAATPARPTAAGLMLRQVSEEGRRIRQLDHAAELDEALQKLAEVAREATGTHAVLYFDLDRDRDRAFLRAAAAPAGVLGEKSVPLRSDPFSFVVDRGQSFYATDFKKLLWSLPYYRGEVKVGTLLALPVRTSGVVCGLLVADRMEIQSLNGPEPALLESFAALLGDTITRVRQSSRRDDREAESKALAEVSSLMAEIIEPPRLRARLLASARDLVAFEGAAVVMADRAQTRYVLTNGVGWAAEFEGREVGLLERTWTAWLLKHDQPSLLLDDIQGHDRMPILVLDEGPARGESLLGVAIRARRETLGALILTGKRGAFDSTAQRVLTILANQAAGSLFAGNMVEREKQNALQDALTGLSNRRAFDEALERAIAREDRQQGRFALILMDIDHFKKLNDTYGHPAGDAALKNTAAGLAHLLRKGDQPARYGGEEFVVILPGTDAAGAAQLAERVRQGVESSRLVFDGARLDVTVSLGVAVWPADGREAAALVAAADRALYAAKQGGRNRVVAASELTPEGVSTGAPATP